MFGGWDGGRGGVDVFLEGGARWFGGVGMVVFWMVVLKKLPLKGGR